LVSLYFSNLWGVFLGWLILALLKGGFHLAYLGKPMRFWRMAINPRTSWLARGFIFLALFFVLGCIQLLFSYFIPETLLEKIVKVISGVLAFLVVINTAFVMNSLSAIKLWNSAILPLLFISCGVLDGLALILIIGLQGRSVDVIAIENGTRLLLIIIAFLITSYLWSSAYAGPTGKQSLLQLIRGKMAFMLWVGVVLFGIFIPMCVSMYSYFIGDVSAPLLITASGCEMIGAFSLKYTILKGALYGPLIPSTT
jgi:sulfite dehydrogenase (quinone) subunit SoeC